FRLDLLPATSHGGDCPMNPIVSALRRPVRTLVLVVPLVSGGVLASNKMPVDHLLPLNMPKVYAYLDYVGAQAKQAKGYIAGQLGSYYHKLESYFKEEEQPHHEQASIVVTSPNAQDVVITEDYVCQIRSQRHIDVCALESGYLEEISVREG